MYNAELTEKQIDALRKIKSLSHLVRYRAIDGAIIIERMISNALVNCLGNEKTKKSLEKYLFYDTLTFDQKINLYNSLNKAGAFNSEDNKELNSDLVKVKTVRNYMAHSIEHNKKSFLDKYDGSEIMFKSFTSKNMISLIKFRIYDENEDMDNLIFSFKALDLRIDRIIKSLEEIHVVKK